MFVLVAHIVVVTELKNFCDLGITDRFRGLVKV